LVKIEAKPEWDGLDVVSKWLIATRSAVTTVTLYSCMIAAFLAVRDGGFRPLPWIIVTLGLFLAHGTNNLLNDLTDYRRGIDSNNYFRTQYGVHPLVQGFWSTSTQVRWFVVSGLLATAAAVYAVVASDFDPLVLGLIAYGSLMLLFYTFPLKYIAVGELTIFLIWGPVMVAGVHYVLTRTWSWDVVLAGIPFGLSTASINIGKHIDKSAEDRQKGVTTLPVLLGQTASRVLNILVILAAYGVTAYLVAARFLTPVMAVVLIAGPRAFQALYVLSKPRPDGPPPGYPIWPTWFSTFAFRHNRWFGNFFVLGVALDTALRLIPATSGFWR
jgi:1,4-dihydroxy-2-naphthoate octaprenyltransferase